MVQCAHRFLVFTGKGSFIEEAEFENEEFFFQKTAEKAVSEQEQNFFDGASMGEESHGKVALRNSKELLQVS